MLTDPALAIFDRLIQLEREGYPTATAVKLIQNVGFHQHQTNGQLLGNETLTLQKKLIAELRARIEEQAKMITYLKPSLMKH